MQLDGQPDQGQITPLSEGAYWENLDATLEESRHVWYDFCMGWQPTEGEYSKVRASALLTC